ncbi:unnamed protein product [Arctogadus glacialis]
MTCPLILHSSKETVERPRGRQGVEGNRLRDCELAPGVNCDLVRPRQELHGNFTQHSWSPQRHSRWPPSSSQLPARQNPIMRQIIRLLHRGGQCPRRGAPLGSMTAEETLTRSAKAGQPHTRPHVERTTSWPSEDHRPNRCALAWHGRGPPPNRVTHGEVSQWQKMW